MKLLRMLGLGLLVIDRDVERHGVDVVLDPGEYRPRRSRGRRKLLLGEFVKRVGDPNVGGASLRNGIMTAYRQRALEIALFLQTNGPTKASQVANAIGEPKARDILYRDVYGWFDRPSNGIYALSPRGVQEVPLRAEDFSSIERRRICVIDVDFYNTGYKITRPIRLDFQGGPGSDVEVDRVSQFSTLRYLNQCSIAAPKENSPRDWRRVMAPENDSGCIRAPYSAVDKLGKDQVRAVCCQETLSSQIERQSTVQNTSRHDKSSCR